MVMEVCDRYAVRHIAFNNANLLQQIILREAVGVNSTGAGTRWHKTRVSHRVRRFDGCSMPYGHAEVCRFAYLSP